MSLEIKSVKDSIVAKLKSRKQKTELSPQAEAVVETFVEVLNDLIGKKKQKTDAPDAAFQDPTRRFTDEWGRRWERRFGGHYKFNGVADAKAARELLKIHSQERLLEMAARAWDKPEEFNCKHAITLRGFASRFNEIRAAVGAVNGAKRESHLTAAGVDTRTGERVFMP